MTPDSRERLWARIALATGALLFLVALRYTNWALIFATGPRLIAAAVASIIVSGAWHVVRTCAWAGCFPRAERLPFGRLFRVRVAAEAVSYVTVRGVAGEPLKVVLLGRDVDARTASAAVALERAAYTIGTAFIVGIGASVAWALLPMSVRGSRAFLVVAISSLAFSAGAGVLIFARRRARLTPGPPASPASSVPGKVRRFLVDVADRFVALARGDRRRLVLLGVTAIASYALMALEVWVVFRVAGMPVSVGQAMAIETFMRVASFASAAIPGNLGALEAASLAAVAAVGSPGGALLALARRMRGLFWAAAGFAIYPGNRVRRVEGHPQNKMNTPTSRGPILLYVAEDPRVEVGPLQRIAGLPIAERIVRAALRADYSHVVVFAGTANLAHLARLDRRVTIAGTAHEWRTQLASLPDSSLLTAIGPGTVVSPSLLRQAALSDGGYPVVADVPPGPGFRTSGVMRVSSSQARDLSDLSDLLWQRIRRREPQPTGEDVASGRARLALRIPLRSELGWAERTLGRATYKQTDARLARFNRRMSLPVSIALLRTPVTANMMSVFVFTLGIAAAWFFSRGEYVAGVIGGALSLAASILDGCDGEIARLKYQESALGCWLETIGDYSYYLAVFVGLTVGAVAQTGWAGFVPIGAIGLTGTILSFVLLIFLRRTITAGQPETLHAVAKARFKSDPSWWSVIVWRISFVATRAAMPYGIFALSLLYLLPLVVVLSAIGANVYWISLVLKLRHLLGKAEPAAAAERQGGLVAS
jgi:phosphatidylglycerophosphate synthase